MGSERRGARWSEGLGRNHTIRLTGQERERGFEAPAL